MVFMLLKEPSSNLSPAHRYGHLLPGGRQSGELTPASGPANPEVGGLLSPITLGTYVLKTVLKINTSLEKVRIFCFYSIYEVQAMDT